MRTKGLRLDQSPPLDVPLRFFLTAPLFGVAAGLLLAVLGRPLLLSPFAPATIALTHLVTLGWVSMVMVGAVYQIMPVLLGAVVPWQGLIRWVHLGMTLGTAGMAGGLLLGSRPVLISAGALLGASFLTVLVQFGGAFARARSATVSGYAIRLAVGSLALTVVLGLVFLGEHLWGWLPMDRAALLGFHVYLALGGWIGGLICGVGFAVIPMFYLAAPFPARRCWLVVGLLTAGLATAPVVLFATPGRWWLLAPLLPSLAALGVFAGTVFGQLRGRQRRVADATLRFWQTGLWAGLAALGCLLVSIPWPGSRWVLAFGGVYLVGFAGAIENGMTYKITPFLVWLHRYSQHAGTMRVPLMADILPRKYAALQWKAHLAALLVLAAALLYPAEGLVRVAGGLLALNCGFWFVNLYRAATHRAELVPLRRADRAPPTPPPPGSPPPDSPPPDSPPPHPVPTAGRGGTPGGFTFS